MAKKPADQDTTPSEPTYDYARYANILTPKWVCWFQDADSSREPLGALVLSNNGQGILSLDVKIHNNNFRKHVGVRHIHDPELATQTMDAKRNCGGWCTEDEFVALTQRMREEKWMRAEEEREAQNAAREMERQRNIKAKAEFEAHLAALAKA
jgi:hypothetical protein